MEGTNGNNGQNAAAQQNNVSGENAGERKFTQAELDAVISDRLSRERAKYADYDTLKDKAAKYDAAEEAGKTELQKAQDKAAALQTQIDNYKKADQLRTMRDKVSKETNVPVNLLTAETEDDCRAQAKAIMEFAKPGSYPQVKDGGEPGKNSTKNTRDLFADWINDRR